MPSPGNPADLNRYSYVRNSPLRYTDPTGHCIPGDNCPGDLNNDEPYIPAPTFASWGMPAPATVAAREATPPSSSTPTSPSTGSSTWLQSVPQGEIFNFSIDRLANIPLLLVDYTVGVQTQVYAVADTGSLAKVGALAGEERASLQFPPYVLQGNARGALALGAKARWIDIPNTRARVRGQISIATSPGFDNWNSTAAAGNEGQVRTGKGVLSLLSLEKLMSHLLTIPRQI